MCALKNTTKMFLGIILILLALFVFAESWHGGNRIDEKIVAAVDQYLSDEGECQIDLETLFSELEWDTVSVFIGGNSKQVSEHLQIDNDISDGIAFHKNGKPIEIATSTYQFPKDEPPKISYYVNRKNPTDPYYVSRPRNNAIVHIKKYMYRDTEYKYLLYFE